MMRRLLTLCMAVIGWVALLAVAPATALDIEFNGGAIKRDVIAIYDSRHEATPQTSRLHQFVEMPVNWLGMTLTYYDVNGALPPPEQVAKFRGVVSWLVEPMGADSAERYLNWLDGATASGLKLVVFTNLAPAAPAKLDKITARIHARIGLETTPDYISVTHHVKATVHTPDMVGFEKPLDPVLPDFRVLYNSDTRATVHLSAKVPKADSDRAIVIISTGPGGGYVADEYATVFDANTDRIRWTLNPFLFLKLALAKERMPVPDVTTLSGRRMYFSHIDGDGWNNVSLVDGYREQQIFSADVVRREVIEPYPDLPVTVGVIAGDTQPELGGSLIGRDIARKLYALPQVEVGSHTYTHPFTWKFFVGETYTRKAEEDLIDKVRAVDLPLLERARRMAVAISGQSLPVDLASRYVAGSSDLPRTYLRYPFDLNKEVAGALAVSESLAPAGKKAKLYQWSGDCLPFEAAIAASRKAGVRNLNGGDSRLDMEYPSVFYVPAISKPVGGQRQIYSGNSNENTYTNDWTGPYFGFSMLGETIRNTETPRRLKPFNIYYHMYSGERESALAALRQNLNLARSMTLTPVAASHYAAIADDFFGVQITQIDPLSWSVLNRGQLQTVRFDDADGLAVDVDKSRGVLGSTRHASGAMYVALDAAIDVATVTLMARPAEPVTEPSRPGAQLVSARWDLRQYQVEGCGFAITAEGYGTGDMVWQTAPGRRFDVTAERGGTQLAHVSSVADATGALQVTLQADATSPLKLRFGCNE